MKENKSKKDDTSQIYQEFNSIYGEISQNKNIKDSTIDGLNHLKELLELKKKEEKGQKIFSLFIFFIILVLSFMIGLYSSKYEELKWDSEKFREIVSVKKDSLNNDMVTLYLDSLGNVITYGELLQKRDSIYDLYYTQLNQNFTLRDSISLYEKAISLAHNNYKLEFSFSNEVVDSTIVRYISVQSLQLDSALLLLPVYRDNLKYDSVKNLWTVTKEVYKQNN